MIDESLFIEGRKIHKVRCDNCHYTKEYEITNVAHLLKKMKEDGWETHHYGKVEFHFCGHCFEEEPDSK